MTVHKMRAPFKGHSRERKVSVRCIVCGRPFDVPESCVANAKYCKARCRLKDTESLPAGDRRVSDA